MDFKEKPQFLQSWMNGRFMVIEPPILGLIQADQTILEKDPMEEAVRRNSIMAFQHEGFWQCMDTLRNSKLVNQLWKKGNAPWKSWESLFQGLNS